MSEDVTVLMTGAGAPGASGIIKSLRRPDSRDVEIVGVDADPDAYGFALLEEGYVVPRGDEEGYVERVREVATEVNADVILPLTTAELDPLAGQRASLSEEGVSVMVSSPTALSVANDKGRLYSFLESEGFDSAPAFRRVDSASAFVDAVEWLGYPERPVCFKRPVASGKRGFRVLDERNDRLDRLLNEKPDSSVTTLEDVLPVLEAAETFPELIVMEHLPGAEYSVDVLARGDSVGPVVPRERTRTRAGISFSGTVEENGALIGEAAEICRRLGLEYNVNLQFKYDAEGDPKVIEINPRVSGTIVMCVGAGANLPYLGLKYALGEPLPAVDVDWGTRMTRFWQEAFYPPSGEPFQLTEAGRVPAGEAGAASGPEGVGDESTNGPGGRSVGPGLAPPRE